MCFPNWGIGFPLSRTTGVTKEDDANDAPTRSVSWRLFSPISFVSPLLLRVLAVVVVRGRFFVTLLRKARVSSRNNVFKGIVFRDTETLDCILYRYGWSNASLFGWVFSLSFFFLFFYICLLLLRVETQRDERERRSDSSAIFLFFFARFFIGLWIKERDKGFLKKEKKKDFERETTLKDFFDF